MKISTDIDIDVANRDLVVDKLSCVPAMIKRKDKTEKHNTGVYVQHMPRDSETHLAVLDYKEAEEHGYFKLDFLNVHFYEDIKSEQHLNELLSKEPMWEMLEHEEFVSKLFHIKDYFWLVDKLRPDSVEKLAAILALIRPSKKYLQDSTWDKIFEEVWVPPADGSYYFKKAHSFGYALAIVVHMNLLIEQLVATAN